jgi:hypothetical protein
MRTVITSLYHIGFFKKRAAVKEEPSGKLPSVVEDHCMSRFLQVCFVR